MFGLAKSGLFNASGRAGHGDAERADGDSAENPAAAALRKDTPQRACYQRRDERSENTRQAHRDRVGEREADVPDCDPNAVPPTP